MTNAYAWRSESDTEAPEKFSEVTDSLTADEALRRVRKGEVLLYRGDFHNARQLLGAMGRRLKTPRHASSPLAVFRAERQARANEHQTLGRIVVQLDAKWKLQLKRAPDTSLACQQAWGAAPKEGTLVALKTLLGVLGAAEWRKKGLAVPGLTRKLTPHYGVYAPTRTDYVELLSKLDNVKGAKCFDIGTGTGVLALALLQKGAASVIGTDIDSRAVDCATDNAKFFKVSDAFKVEERPLFPNGRADIVVCNPPWVPETPKNRVDHAIFDGGGEVLRGFLEGLREHLSGHGRGVLILSDLAVLLGLREPGFLKSEFERCGLQLRSTSSTTAKHGKAKDSEDPLFAVRSKETTSLYVLTAG